MYFNYFIHKRVHDGIMDRLRSVASRPWNFVNEHTDTQFRRYCERSGDTYHSIKYPTQVLEYSELYSMAEKECPNVADEVKQITDREFAKTPTAGRCP